MSTSQQFLVCDSSTLANFKQWAQAISSFFTTAGWTQSTDTGQVNWGTIVSVPGSNAYVYEVWQPNDGLTTFYVKMEYGNQGGANNPSIRITMSSTTNGAGTATGFIVGPQIVSPATVTPLSTTIQYECDFSGAAGRIGAIMWRNAISNNINQLFAIERSVNSSGTYTSSHVTLWTVGQVTARQFQATLLFGVGVGPNIIGPTSQAGWSNRCWVNTGGSSAFNGSIAFDTCAPNIGYFDYQATMVGAANALDITEGVTFTVTLYGATRTYMPTKNGIGGGNYQNYNAAACLRYD